MKYGLLGLLLVSGLTLPSLAAGEEKPTVVPVTKAPFHLFTFQDENMSLENVAVPAGRSTTYHSHDQDLFFVITSGAKVKNQPLGKDPVDLDFKLGNVYFAWYIHKNACRASNHQCRSKSASAAGIGHCA